MIAETPIKRHIKLRPVSHDHHQGLLFCWKITTGLSKNIDPVRIKKYADWFWKWHLKFHFEEEEKQILALVHGHDSEVSRVLTEHRELEALFEYPEAEPLILEVIADRLRQHIRYEERVLFRMVQEETSENELDALHLTQNDPKAFETWPDEFWK